MLNLELWKSINTTPAVIVSRARDVHREWSCMQKAKFTQPNSDSNFSWTKPPNGTIKCNVDAATFNNNSMVGYGMCFRDSLGQLFLGKSDYMKFSATVLEVETIGLLEAMKMAISSGIHNVIFETDSRSLVNALYSTTTPLNEFGDLVIQCKNILLSNHDFMVSFVRRQVNTVAHSIARAALSHLRPFVFHVAPTTMYSLIMNEMQ